MGPLILMLPVMYLLLILPKQKEQKKLKKMVSELKKGDKVLIQSGFFCTIIEKKDTSFMVLLGDNTKVEVIASVVVKKIEA
jgi:preprotein translocase subunit YajC